MNWLATHHGSDRAGLVRRGFHTSRLQKMVSKSACSTTNLPGNIVNTLPGPEKFLLMLKIDTQLPLAVTSEVSMLFSSTAHVLWKAPVLCSGFCQSLYKPNTEAVSTNFLNLSLYFSLYNGSHGRKSFLRGTNEINI